jgi:hypothetical protein
MNITEFARKYRLKLKSDCVAGIKIIFGRTGQIYEYALDLLCVMFVLPCDATPSPRIWHSARTKCVAAGMTLRQNGDAEGCLSFDSENEVHAHLAIKVAGVKRIRNLSEELRSDLVDRAAHARRVRNGLIKNEGSAL